MAWSNLIPRGGEIVIYQTEEGLAKIEVRLEGETLCVDFYAENLYKLCGNFVHRYFSQAIFLE